MDGHDVTFAQAISFVLVLSHTNDSAELARTFCWYYYEVFVKAGCHQTPFLEMEFLQLMFYEKLIELFPSSFPSCVVPCSFVDTHTIRASSRRSHKSGRCYTFLVTNIYTPPAPETYHHWLLSLSQPKGGLVHFLQNAFYMKTSIHSQPVLVHIYKIYKIKILRLIYSHISIGNRPCLGSLTTGYQPQ